MLTFSAFDHYYDLLATIKKTATSKRLPTDRILRKMKKKSGIEFNYISFMASEKVT